MIVTRLIDTNGSRLDRNPSEWPNTVVYTRGRTSDSPEHAAPFSIHCSFRGREVYECGDGRFAVSGPAYLLLSEGRRVSTRVAGGEPLESVSVIFDAVFAKEALARLETGGRGLDPADPGPGPGVSLLEGVHAADRLVSPILEGLRSAVSSGQAPQGWLEERFHFLLSGLVQAHRGLRLDWERVPAMRVSTRIELFRRLRRARDFIDASLEQGLRLSDMAHVACISTHRFLRLFKETFGETPHQYLTRRRLEAARSILSTSDKPVTEVGLEVGFDSLGSFSWLFRRRFGLSPSAFRAASRR